MMTCVNRWVDIVMGSVGEDSDKIGRLTDLSGAIGVYASLLTARLPDLDSFLALLSLQNQALKNNPNAPDMLVWPSLTAAICPAAAWELEARVHSDLETLTALNDEAVSMEAAQVARLEKIAHSGVFHLYPAKHRDGKMVSPILLSSHRDENLILRRRTEF